MTSTLFAEKIWNIVKKSFSSGSTGSDLILYLYS
mgnify:FL=1